MKADMGEGLEGAGLRLENRFDLTQDLGQAVAQGSEVFTSGFILSAEFVAIDPEGSVTYARRHEDSYTVMQVTTGLEVAGVLRRQGFLQKRRLVECAVMDVQRGDRVVLQTPGGEKGRVTTKKLRSDWGATIRAQADKFLRRG